MTFKGRQRPRGEPDRTEDYRNWRHTFGNKQYVMDLDQVEYKIVDDKIIPCAVLELTRTDEAIYGDGSALYAAVFKRIKIDGSQGKALIEMADRLGVEAYIVLFVKDLSEFHIYNLSTDVGWYRCDQDGYVRFVKFLRREKNGVAVKAAESLSPEMAAAKRLGYLR